MSKFATIVILGLALFAYIQALPVDEFPVDEFPEEEESQAIATDAATEVADLEGTPYSVFSDFCLKSRDYVYGDMKTNANGLSSRVYGLFFKAAADMGKEALEVSKMGTQRMTAQLSNPGAPIAEPTNDSERIIAEGQQNIQDVPTQPKALVEAFKNTVRAVGAAVNKQFAQRMDDLKKLADVGTVISTLQTVCSSIEEYEINNQKMFEKAKAELVEVDPKLAFVEMSQVPCVTSRTVSRLDSLCKFVVAAKEPLAKMASTFTLGQSISQHQNQQ